MIRLNSAFEGKTEIQMRIHSLTKNYCKNCKLIVLFMWGVIGAPFLLPGIIIIDKFSSINIELVKPMIKGK